MKKSEKKPKNASYLSLFSMGHDVFLCTPSAMTYGPHRMMMNQMIKPHEFQKNATDTKCTHLRSKRTVQSIVVEREGTI